MALMSTGIDYTGRENSQNEVNTNRKGKRKRVVGERIMGRERGKRGIGIELEGVEDEKRVMEEERGRGRTEEGPSYLENTCYVPIILKLIAGTVEPSLLSRLTKFLQGALWPL